MCSELTERLADDLHAAFADLIAAHGGLVFGVALRVMTDRGEAEDAAQETFVRAYRALQRYPADRIRQLRLRAWLAQIALNVARNAIRERANSPPRDTDGLDRAADLAAGDGHMPHALLEQKEERAAWSRLLAELPERYRVPVALRHVEGLSYPEVSGALGRPVGTVKSDVHRGVRMLRAAYEAAAAAAAEGPRKEELT